MPFGCIWLLHFIFQLTDLFSDPVRTFWPSMICSTQLDMRLASIFLQRRTLGRTVIHCLDCSFHDRIWDWWLRGNATCDIQLKHTEMILWPSVPESCTCFQVQRSPDKKSDALIHKHTLFSSFLIGLWSWALTQCYWTVSYIVTSAFTPRMYNEVVCTLDVEKGYATIQAQVVPRALFLGRQSPAWTRAWHHNYAPYKWPDRGPWCSAATPSFFKNQGHSMRLDKRHCLFPTFYKRRSYCATVMVDHSSPFIISSTVDHFDTISWRLPYCDKIEKGESMEFFFAT